MIKTLSTLSKHYHDTIDTPQKTLSLLSHSFRSDSSDSVLYFPAKKILKSYPTHGASLDTRHNAKGR